MDSLLDAAVLSCSAQLQNLGNDELRNLLADDEKLDGMIKDIPQLKSVESEKEMLLAQNKSLAEYNLSQVNV